MNYVQYPVEELGLTRREVQLLLDVLRGILPQFDSQLTSYRLACELYAAAGQSTLDHDKFGLDLSRPHDDTAETPYKIQDLAEKISKLADESAAGLWYFAIGFWSGVSAKSNFDRK